MTNKGTLMFDIGAMPDQLDPEVLALLQQAETATIGHFRHMGFVNRSIQCATSPAPVPRIAGTAVTLALPGFDSTMLHYALSDTRPGDILVIDRLGDDRHACWGGGVARAAVAAGVRAAVIDGPCTDASEIAAEGFPLWCRGSSSITTRVLGLGGAMNVPVSCGGAVVMPGDAVLADESGVVVMRPWEARAAAEEAIRRQERGAEREEAMRSGAVRIGEVSGARKKVEAALASA